MRTRYRMERRALLGGAAGFALSAVPGARVPVAQTLDRVSFQTNWRAQAEHGGYYHAVAAASIAATGSSARSARAGRSRTRRNSCWRAAWT
jgi:hypothetical protein